MILSLLAPDKLYFRMLGGITIEEITVLVFVTSGEPGGVRKMLEA